jgi:N-acetylmuramoyl-L-alanine amidase
MRRIDYIVLHCTATSQQAKVESIQRYWREELKWKSPGYHVLIEASGKVHQLQPIALPTNGVAGYNANSIHISYIGGMHGDDRTKEQRAEMELIVRHLKAQFPNAKIQGHRDFPNVRKACPNFDVAKWLNEVCIDN